MNNKTLLFVFLTFFPVSSFSQISAELATSQAAIASAHPLATQAGIDILTQGDRKSVV